MPQQEMIFSDYLRVIVKRKWTVIFVTILVAAMTFAYASKKKPRFSSSARVKVQRLQTFAQMFDEILVSSGDPMENYKYEIQGEDVITMAQKKLNEHNQPDNVPLAGDVTVARIESTDIMNITVLGASPSNAQQRCEAVITSFVTSHDEKMTRDARDEFDDIKKSLDSAVNDLKKLDNELRKELGDELLNNTGYDQTEYLSQRLTEANIRLQTLKDDGNYTDDYPEIVALNKTLKIIQSQLKENAEKNIATRSIMQSHEQKKKILENMVSYLSQRLEEARLAQTKKSERIDVIVPATLGSPITTAKAYLTSVGTLLGLMLGIILAFVAENLDTSIRTLVEIEEIFRLPILGVIPHFSPHMEDVPIRPEGLRDKLKYSDAMIIWKAMFSALKRKKGKNFNMPSSGGLIAPFSTRAPATEGYRAIRTNLQLTANHEKLGAILVTSPGPAEGKSTTITNLAFVFAQSGAKTLLVGANMRRPSIYRTFGLQRENGLSDVLAGEVSWRSVIKDNRDLALGEKADENIATVQGAENLFFITAGGRTIQPTEWLSQPIFQALIKEWEKEYDVVLIDGPPILPVPDSVIMSSVIGKVILVYQSGSTQRDSMLRAISLVKKTGATVAGLVLNNLQASWSTSPDYYHYRGYYGRPEK